MNILSKFPRSILFTILIFNNLGCESNIEIDSESQLRNEQLFITTLQKHLDAVSTKNLDSLKSTLSPTGEMMLILPNSEISKTVDKFLEFHEEWFKDSTWTFETKILSTEIGENIGIAVTEIIYREANRNGKPYFNRMNVSYALKIINNNWYVIKDHASSIEKSI